jgi:hypothetical protein
MNLQQHLEKATKEFVYPTILPTQEEIDFVVIPMMEAMTAFLKELREEKGDAVYGPYLCDKCDMAQITLDDLIEASVHKGQMSESDSK